MSLATIGHISMYNWHRIKVMALASIPTFIGMWLTVQLRDSTTFDSRGYMALGLVLSMFGAALAGSRIEASADRALERVWASPSRDGFSDELIRLGRLSQSVGMSARSERTFQRGLEYLERCVLEGHHEGKDLGVLEWGLAKNLLFKLKGQPELLAVAPNLAAYLEGAVQL